MNYQIISDSSSLQNICQQARLLGAQGQAIMLDTEFVRTRTFHPQLGLIQLYDGQNLSLIDPLAIDDMSAFAELLSDQKVLKVLHACGEDLEVFQHYYGCLPTPMVDTQIMAAFLGNGLSTGFGRLVHKHLEIKLDKSESRADWLARPLTDKQLDYAAADVFYLLPLFEQLKNQLVTREPFAKAPLDFGVEPDWWQAVLQESQFNAHKRMKPLNINEAYKKIKGAWLLDSEQLAILNLLAQWRINEAVTRDLALNFVVKEANLYEIARQKMTRVQDMLDAGFDEREVNRHGNTLIKLVEQGLALDKSEHPERIKRLMDEPQYKESFKTLKEVINQIAEQTGLASEFLASKKQLHQFMSWMWRKNQDPNQLPDVMQGWRKQFVGDFLQQAFLSKVYTQTT